MSTPVNVSPPSIVVLLFLCYTSYAWNRTEKSRSLMMTFSHFIVFTVPVKLFGFFWGGGGGGRGVKKCVNPIQGVHSLMYTCNRFSASDKSLFW